MEQVLSFMAHPDDTEIFCAGTLTLLQEKGFEIHIATMTPGDCGSAEHSASETARIRIAEARAAAGRIRANYHCAGRRDFQVAYDAPTIQAAVEIVRRVAPSIVITHTPQDSLLEHEFTSLVVRNACFAATAPNFDTGHVPAHPATASVPHLYYAAPSVGIDILGLPILSTLYIDISNVMGLKADMLACHKSQQEWLGAHHGVGDHIEEMRARARELGSQSGVEYAEGFRQHLGHPYPKDDKLSQLVGTKASRRLGP